MLVSLQKKEEGKGGKGEEEKKEQEKGGRRKGEKTTTSPRVDCRVNPRPNGSGEAVVGTPQIGSLPLLALTRERERDPTRVARKRPSEETTAKKRRGEDPGAASVPWQLCPVRGGLDPPFSPQGVVVLFLLPFSSLSLSAERILSLRSLPPSPFFFSPSFPLQNPSNICQRILSASFLFSPLLGERRRSRLNLNNILGFSPLFLGAVLIQSSLTGCTLGCVCRTTTTTSTLDLRLKSCDRIGDV